MRKMIFPKFVDRTEIGLAESLNEFHSLVEINCPNFDEVFRVVPSNSAIWIETHELGSNYWHGKRTKIADRGYEFDLNLTYLKVNRLIDENLKIKSIQSLKNERRLEIENILDKFYKRKYNIDIKADSYKITILWKNLFKIQLFHEFNSNLISIQDFKFDGGIGISGFNDLEKTYISTKIQVEEITNQLETNLIPILPKF